MKNVLLLLIVALMFSSCSKTEVELSLADQTAGNYQGSSINIGGTVIKLPLQDGTYTLSVAFEISKISETQIDVVQIFTEVENGKKVESKDIIKNLSLVKNTDGSISIKDAKSVEYGLISNKTLSLKQNLNGIEAIISAEKK